MITQEISKAKAIPQALFTSPSETNPQEQAESDSTQLMTRDRCKGVRTINVLSISNEGDILIKSIKTNIVEIQSNICMAYTNMNNPQVNQPTKKPTNDSLSLSQEIQKLHSTIQSLQLENKSLKEEVSKLKEARPNKDKHEVISYQKKYLTEMKEIEAYLALVTQRFTSKLEAVKREKNVLVKHIEEHKADSNKLRLENVKLKTEIGELAEVHQYNIGILKHKLEKIKSQYESMNENKTHCKYSPNRYGHYMSNTPTGHRIAYKGDDY